MKKVYITPEMYAETFVANQYVAACGDTITTVPAMQVRCQSGGHQNIAKDTIFADGNSACIGKYNSSLTNDNCHSQSGWYGHEGKRSYGTGYVKGTWQENVTTSGQDGSLTASWFYEGTGGSDLAYKGYFQQGGHYHLFYATTDQAEQFQAS